MGRREQTVAATHTPSSGFPYSTILLIVSARIAAEMHGIGTCAAILTFLKYYTILTIIKINKQAMSTCLARSAIRIVLTLPSSNCPPR